MSGFEPDLELYKKWLEGKTVTIEAMKTVEDVHKRIIELQEVKFYVNREWALLSDKTDKITGRKGIAPWLKEERDKLITDPNFKVNTEAEPRPKKPKSKASYDLQNLLGIDIKELTKAVMDKKKADSTPKPINAKPDSNLNDAISSLMRPAAPKKPELSDDEKKKKADEMKEKIRLAKESKG
jgi:hypothetical protein